MKILAISDYHGAEEYIQPLNETAIKEKIDIIVFSGDIVKGTARGTEWLTAKKEGRKPNQDKENIKTEKDEDLALYRNFYENILKEIPMLVVPGNMDAPEKRYFSVTLNLNANNIHPIHGELYYSEDYVFSGFGGEITEDIEESFFVLQYPGAVAKHTLKKLKYIRKQKILILHSPPISKIGQEGDLIFGSKTVNELISEIKPKILFCGHAHKAQGKDTIENTLCVNPGPLKYGNIAIVDTENLNVEILKLGKR